MPDIVRIPAGPTEPGILEQLRNKKVILLERQPRVQRALAEAGIEHSVLEGNSIPSECTLVLAPSAVDDLICVVDRLLGPGGCPWDQAQTHESLKKYLLEEAYDVFDAIDSEDSDLLCEELGDLLLQPILHAQISKAAGGFDSQQVATGIVDKLIRRHPHVFGDTVVADADEVLKNWDKIKKTEKGDEPRSILTGVPKAMAALLRAHEVSKRAARIGFEWPDIESVFDKLHEEEAELQEALKEGNQEAISSELGDLLFTVVNIARWAKVEPEEALRVMVDRFTRRFICMETLTEKDMKTLSQDQWNDLWLKAKDQVG